MNRYDSQPFLPASLPLPAGVQTLITEAERRVDDFMACAGEAAPTRFVPCDFVLVFDALRALRRDPDLPGLRFREWGSGFGVVTCLADWLGFEAVGIEQQPILVQEARRLAKDFGSRARFVQGSFAAHDEDYTPKASEADLVFVYPWPDEEQPVEQCFREQAPATTWGLVYLGLDELRLLQPIGS